MRICLPAVPRPGETVVVLGSHGRSYIVKDVGYAGYQLVKPVDDRAKPGQVLLVVSDP